jgi:CBS domain-containing protein
MTREVCSCGPDESLERAAQSMWEADIGSIPVIEGARVVGMLTDRDICMAAYTQGRPLSDIRVGEVMARRIATCRPTDGIDRLGEIMREHRVRRVPVVDARGQLVGIVSVNDLVRSAHTARRGHAELVATLAAISQPRQAAAQPTAA